VEEVVGQFVNVGALVSVWPCWVTCTTHVHDATLPAASMAEKKKIVLPCVKEDDVEETGIESASFTRVLEATPTLSTALGAIHE
jgi:hypothetical protein